MSRSFSCGRTVGFALGISLIFSLGCGRNDGIPDTVPVSGKVTVDGEPVTAGQVSLFAFDKEQKTGAQITGKIDPSGGYVLYTGGKTGAPPGRYKVTITPEMVPTPDKKMFSVPFNTKFTDVARTPLMLQVPSSEYDLKLTK
jgi:hypothetical protein